MKHIIHSILNSILNVFHITEVEQPKTGVMIKSTYQNGKRIIHQKEDN